MNCKKCGYDFGELTPKYCPECGKKVTEEIKPLLRNIDYLYAVDKTEFNEIWDEYRNLDAEEAYKKLFEMHPPVFGWRVDMIITATGACTDFGCNLRKIETALHNPSNKKIQFKATRCQLRKSHYAQTDHTDPHLVNWWKTEEECKNAVNDLITKKSIKGIE